MAKVVGQHRLDGPRLPIYSPVCAACRHLRTQGAMNERTCDAFPAGIPDIIWRGDNPHTQPVAGDHGIRFTPFTSLAEVQEVRGHGRI